MFDNMVLMTDPDFDLEAWRQDRAAAEAESTRLREEGDAYITRRRAEGASFKKIGDEMGVSDTAVRKRAGEFDADTWIRSKVSRGGESEDANQWVRDKLANSTAYRRKAAIRDRLAGRTEGDQAS